MAGGSGGGGGYAGGYGMDAGIGINTYGGSSGGGYGGYAQAFMAVVSFGFWLYSLFNPKKAPKPEPEELQYNNFTRNAPVPICYGTNKYAGTLIYIGNVSVSENYTGGKGMGGDQFESYSYNADFAIGFSEGEILGFLDIFEDDNSIIDKINFFSYEQYLGSSDQSIDVSVLSELGSASAIPWRNTAYLFFSGSLGRINQVPTVSAEVAGILAYGQEIYDDWVQIGELLDIVNYSNYIPIKGFIDDTLTVQKLKWILTKSGVIYLYDVDPIEETWNIDTSWNYTPYGNVVTMAPDLGYFAILYFTTGTYTYPNSVVFHINGVHVEHHGLDMEEWHVSTGNKYKWLRCDGFNFLLRLRAYNGTWDRLYTIPINMLGSPSYEDYIDEDWYDYCPLGNFNSGDNNFYYTKMWRITYYDAVSHVSTYKLGYSGATGKIAELSFDFSNEAPMEAIKIDNFYYVVTRSNSYRDINIYKIDEAFSSIELVTKANHSFTLSEVSSVCCRYESGVLFVCTTVVNPGGASPNTYSRYVYKWRVGSTDDLELLPVPGQGYWGSNTYEIYKNRLCGCVMDVELYHPSSTWFEYLNYFNGLGADANPIEVCYDFMTNDRYGMGISTDLFDGSPYTTGTWRTEYLYCQEEVKIFETEELEARFAYSEAFDQRKKGYDIVNEILQTCRGFLYYCDGKIKVKIQKNNETPVIYLGYDTANFVTNDYDSDYLNRIYIDFSSYPDDYWNGDTGTVQIMGTYGSKPYGDWGYGSEDDNPDDPIEFIIINQTSTYLEVYEDFSQVIPQGSNVVLTKDNVKKNSFQYSKRSAQEKHNKIRVEYINREDGYRTDVIEYEDHFDIMQTDEIRELFFSMTGIKRNSQARRMCQFLSDYDTYTEYQCSYMTDILGLALCEGDIVGITNPIMNWQAKLFRVVTMEELEDYETKLDFVEYNPHVFHDYSVDKQVSYFFKDEYKFNNPGQVERLELFEDSYLNKVYITFKKPDEDAQFWVGAEIYYRWNENDVWETSGQSHVPTASVQLVTDISIDETEISYDDSTLYDSFPSSGTFWIESEEIYYSGIDVINHKFLNCERGYNDTQESAHSNDKFCVFHNSELYYISFEKVDVGKTLYIKAVSVNSYKVYADGSSSPTASLQIVGYKYLPLKPGSVKWNLI